MILGSGACNQVPYEELAVKRQANCEGLQPIRKQPSIAAEISRLWDVINLLSDRTSDANDRLQPVLRSEFPTPCNTCEDASDTQFGQTLQGMRSKLSGIDDQLRSILDRLEI